MALHTLAGTRLLQHPVIISQVQQRPHQTPNRLTGWHLDLFHRSCRTFCTFDLIKCNKPHLWSSYLNNMIFSWIPTNHSVLIMLSYLFCLFLVCRPALGGLLTSSYRQHQESLAAERERRRLEREERLQRIEREERNRFKLVSLYQSFKNCLSSCQSEYIISFLWTIGSCTAKKDMLVCDHF